MRRFKIFVCNDLVTYISFKHIKKMHVFSTNVFLWEFRDIVTHGINYSYGKFEIINY